MNEDLEPIGRISCTRRSPPQYRVAQSRKALQVARPVPVRRRPLLVGGPRLPDPHHPTDTRVGYYDMRAQKALAAGVRDIGCTVQAFQEGMPPEFSGKLSQGETTGKRIPRLARVPICPCPDVSIDWPRLAALHPRHCR